MAGLTFDRRALTATMQLQEQLIREVFDEYVEYLARYGFSVNPKYVFRLENVLPKKEVERIMNNLHSEVEKAIHRGVDYSWSLSDAKNDQIVSQYLRTAPLQKVSSELIPLRNKMMERAFSSREAFKLRSKYGHTLSTRVWNIANQFKAQSEMAMQEIVRQGLAEGTSSAKMATELKKFLNEPDKLFRRIKQDDGTFRLSRQAKLYKPGQGIYRSSYKNALRLARTEVNQAYRVADHTRMQQLDFVVGKEIVRSNNEFDCDICESLKGKYPKDFVFTGWHPNCYTDDTEVLTDKGWKPFSELSGEKIFSLNPDTRQPEFVNYVRGYKHHYAGDIIHYNNRSLDLAVTPEHPIVYLDKGNGGIRSDKVAKDYASTSGGLYRTSEYTAPDIGNIAIGDSKIPFDVFCEFMGYYLADGSISWTRPNAISISKSKELKPNDHKKIEVCVSKLQLGGYTTSDKICITDECLYNYLRQFGKAPDKYVPKEIKNASARQIGVFLEAFIMCDGHSRKGKPFVGNRGTKFTPKREEKTFFTTSNQLAADIGELLVKTGKRPSYALKKSKGVAVEHHNGVYKGNHDVWVIRVCYSKTATSFRKDVFSYSGFVYDVELERNHILYVRRNGKCVWGSNCRCQVLDILASPEEFAEYIQSGELKTNRRISTAPKAFESYNGGKFSKEYNKRVQQLNNIVK